MFPSLDPGMQVRNQQTFPGLHAQLEVDRVAFGDLSLVDGALNGSLNRAEFLALSARQNELTRLAGRLAGDGWLDDQERAQLVAQRDGFYATLEEYRGGDCQPQVDPQAGSSSFLYDSIRSGKLDRQQAFLLRMHESSFHFARGAAEPDGMLPAS